MTLLYFIVSPRGLNPWPQKRDVYKRQILCLSLDNTSYQEAAAILNISRKSYGNQLGRIRRKLEHILRKFSEEA